MRVPSRWPLSIASHRIGEIVGMVRFGPPGVRAVLTARGKPVAAIVSLGDLHCLEQQTLDNEARGLAAKEK